MYKNVKKKNEIEDLSVDEIRNRGKKLGFSYTQSLSLFLFEKILYWTAKSETKEEIWMKPVDFYQKGVKKRTAPNLIIYYMKQISYESLKQFVDCMVSDKNNKNLALTSQILYFDKQIEIVINAKLEQVPITFKIIVRPVWDTEQVSEERKYTMLLWDDLEITYSSYPLELNLAECFYEIIDKLELIGNMKSYGNISKIISKFPLDGRRMYINMKELLEKQPISSLDRRWDTVLTYKNYTYMKKRWDKHMKSEKEGKISWEENMTLLQEFFTPIWNAISEDKIFYGDWMPDLGRYLS